MTPENGADAYEQDWYRTLKARAAGEEEAPQQGDDESATAPRPAPLTEAEQAAALEAVEAIGEIGGASAVTALMECLRDPDAPVRARSLELLGDLGDRRPVALIRELAGSDPEPAVVNAAKTALARLDVPI